MEHRWGARSKLDIPVQVKCGSQALVLGVMRDASVSGAFLCTAAQLPVLASVSVKLTSGRFRSPGIGAQVVRRASDGFGLEWSELAPAVIIELLSAGAVVAPRRDARPEPATITVQPRPVDIPATASGNAHVARRPGA